MYGNSIYKLFIESELELFLSTLVNSKEHSPINEKTKSN
jgi:hypothetical protein